MAIKVFADGANLEGMIEMYEGEDVQGFTTNPTLMRAGGVTDYRSFASAVLEKITDLPVSFEVFADDEEGMEAEAREIASWADNVYVKIPALNTKGESTSALVARLSADGVKVNVTTLFTIEQTHEFIDAVDKDTPSIISVFAGRIADTGVDPKEIVSDAVSYAAPQAQLRDSLGLHPRAPEHLPSGGDGLSDHHGLQRDSRKARQRGQGPA